MGCCPNNVNPIPPTKPPVRPPTEPPPDYTYPTAFNSATDKMVLATTSGIRIFKQEGNSAHYDDTVPASGTAWYEFEIPSTYIRQYYLQWSVVDYPVPGSGDGTTFAEVAWDIENIECGKSGPRYEVSTDADTDGSYSSCIVPKDSKLYFKVINNTDVVTGYRLSWSFADY